MGEDRAAWLDDPMERSDVGTTPLKALLLPASMVNGADQGKIGRSICKISWEGLLGEEQQTTRPRKVVMPEDNRPRREYDCATLYTTHNAKRALDICASSSREW